MTNFPDDPIADGDPATTQLNADLTDLFAAPVPDLRFQRPVVAPAAPKTRGFSFGLRAVPAIAAVVVAAALGAVLIVPGLTGDEATVSAAAILERTSAVAEGDALTGDAGSYHLVATTEVSGGAPSISETWYGGADRFRTEYDWSDDGTNASSFGQVTNGDDMWLFMEQDGVTRAVHGATAILGQSFVPPSTATSLADVLTQYSGSCQKAETQGEATVAGREAYEIVVTPDVEECGAPEERLKVESLAGSVLRLWVDQETFLTLRMEQGDTDGLVSYRYDVTELEMGAEIAESRFTYEAAAGVTIQEATDNSDAKNKLSGH